MPVVRRTHRNKIHPLTYRQLQFLLDQLRISAVAALLIQDQLLGHLLALSRINIECSAYKFHAPVKSRRPAVHVANERPRTAADHPHLQCSIKCHFKSLSTRPVQ